MSNEFEPGLNETPPSAAPITAAGAGRFLALVASGALLTLMVFKPG